MGIRVDLNFRWEEGDVYLDGAMRATAISIEIPAKCRIESCSYLVIDPVGGGRHLLHGGLLLPELLVG